VKPYIGEPRCVHFDFGGASGNCWFLLPSCCTRRLACDGKNVPPMVCVRAIPCCYMQCSSTCSANPAHRADRWAKKRLGRGRTWGLLHFLQAPRAARSDDAAWCAVVCYQHVLPQQPLVPWRHLPLSAKACGILLQFTLGRSHLPLHTSWQAPPRTPRLKHVCALC